MVKRKKKIPQEVKKRKITATIIAIIIFIITFLINQGTVLRILLSLIAIGILTTAICYREKKLREFIPLIVIAILLLNIIVDTIVSYTFKRIPVYSYNIVTNGNNKVYNAVGIRVWQCDKNSNKNLKVTPFYERGFTCNPEDMDSIDANSFLQSVEKNYDDYKNNYLKIKGKISKISGTNIVELQAYENAEITVNGYVEFFENITLRVILDSKDYLNTFDVYDDITLVGIIKNIDKTDNKTVVYMYEGKVVSDINLEEYDITVSSIKNCDIAPELIFSDGFDYIYSYCVNDVIISYNEENKYELSAALSAGKITLNQLLNDTTKKEDNEIGTLYTSKNYNIVKCNNGYIIGDSKLSLNEKTCSLISNNE